MIAHVQFSRSSLNGRFALVLEVWDLKGEWWTLLGRNSSLGCGTLLTLGSWLGLPPIATATTVLSSFLATRIDRMHFRRSIRAIGSSLMNLHQKLVLLFSEK
ncbi:hypothetical protein ACFXTI_008922 [Malus domestica]